MRVIGGRLSGRPLSGPGKDDDSIRPTSDRMREALFNILGHGEFSDTPSFQDMRVLDLFAGTGALGIEAVSRGADFCLFIDNAPQARALIRQNVENLMLAGRTKIWRRDATRLGVCHSRPFDLVFLDPPYSQATELAPKAISSASQGNWLSKNALIAIEMPKSAAIPSISGCLPVKQRHQSASALYLFRHS